MKHSSVCLTFERVCTHQFFNFFLRRMFQQMMNRITTYAIKPCILHHKTKFSLSIAKKVNEWERNDKKVKIKNQQFFNWKISIDLVMKSNYDFTAGLYVYVEQKKQLIVSRSNILIQNCRVDSIIKTVSSGLALKAILVAS